MLQSSVPNVVDLFCGCSGFGLGATQAGFNVTLSVDVDATLTSAHAINFPNNKLLLADIAGLSGSELSRAAGCTIDGIIGGPPCQGFSSIGRSNPDDPRRGLVYHYFRLVREIRPKFFIMENVKGILFDKNRAVLDEGLSLVDPYYALCGPVVLDAANFGAPTTRRRVFVIGFLRTEMDVISSKDLEEIRFPRVTVKDALYDLRGAKPLQSKSGFDLWSYGASSPTSKYQRSLRNAAGFFSGHKKTPHRPDIAARFADVKPGETDKIGRHPRLAWEGTCPTLRAGTGADKGSYQAVRPLHPEEPRVITVREAARLQGFPDSFNFHPTVWHSFRMIGNSVSPAIARHLLGMVLERLLDLKCSRDEGAGVPSIKSAESAERIG